MIISKLYRCASNKNGVINGIVAGVASSTIALFLTILFAISPMGETPALITHTTGFFVGILGLLIFGIPVVQLKNGLNSLKYSLSASFMAYILTSFAVFGFGYALILGLYAPSLFLVIVIVVAEEVLFWLDDQPRPSDIGVMEFTMLKKGEALIDLSAGLGIAADIIVFYRYSGQVVSDVETTLKVLAPLFEYVAIVGIIVLGGIGFIYANSLKYRSRKKDIETTSPIIPEPHEPLTPIGPSTLGLIGAKDRMQTICRGCGNWRSQSKCQKCGRL